MTAGTSVPSGSVSDSCTARSSFSSLSKTIENTDVRTNCPDSKTLAVNVPVQSELTVNVPFSVSLANPPPTLRASVPEKSPFALNEALPTAANGIGVGDSGRR